MIRCVFAVPMPRNRVRHHGRCARETKASLPIVVQALCATVLSRGGTSLRAFVGLSKYACIGYARPMSLR